MDTVTMETDNTAHSPHNNEHSQRVLTRPFINILVCGTVMCFVYTAYFPGSTIQDIVIEDNGTLDNKTGYFSQGIIYISSIFIALLAPFIINVLGSRACMVSATLLYVGVFMGMILLKSWSVYLGSVITGFGMGMLWVVNPKIVTDNSTQDTLQRNCSIYWCIYMFSMVAGNMANYFYLGDLEVIGSTTRVMIYLVCCIIIVVGALIGFVGYKEIDPSDTSVHSYEDLLSSRSIHAQVDPSYHRYEELSNSRTIQAHGSEQSEPVTALEHVEDVLRRCRLTLFRREVAYLIIILVFNGVTLSFYTMTFGTCVGNLHTAFPERNLIPLMGIVLGSVEVIGSLFFEKVATLLGNRRTTVILFCIATSSYYLTFLVFPQASTERVIVDEQSYISPKTWLVLLISALTALSDAGFNILANTYTSRMFLADSEIGFMLLNAIMSITTGTFFFISSSVSLYMVLASEVVLCFVTTMLILLNLLK